MKLDGIVKNPVTGGGMKLSIMGVLGMVLGGAVILLIFDWATNLKNRAKAAIPAGVPFIGNAAQSVPAQQAAAKPAFRSYGGQ